MSVETVTVPSDVIFFIFTIFSNIHTINGHTCTFLPGLLLAAMVVSLTDHPATDNINAALLVCPCVTVILKSNYHCIHLFV